MLRLVLIAFATLAGCMAQAPQVSQEPPAIRMLSWNIENFFDRWDDPYRRDQITKPAYASDARMERVAKVLQAFDADVVALQEVENRWHLEQFVDKYLGDMGYEVVHFEGNDTRGIDVALLSRIPLGEVTSYRHIRFKDSKGKEQHFRRDLLRVRVEGNFQTDVYVVHLKSQWGDEVADVVRESESAAILKIIQGEIKKNPAYRGVVCGDFNEVPEMPTLGLLRDGGLVDPMKGTEKYTYNKDPYLTRIDYAMCTPSLASTLLTAEVIDESPVEGVRLEDATDHYPLLVTFSPTGL